MEKEFIRVRSVKDIVITFSLIIAGSICVALPTSQSINILGFFMVFAGLLLLFILKTGYKDVSSGLSYSKTERYFAQSIKEDILNQLRSRALKIDLKNEDQGNGLRLDIYHSKKAGKTYVQAFEYVPYKYEPCSPLFEYELSETKSLI